LTAAAGGNEHGRGNRGNTGKSTHHDRRRASSKPTPPRMTNNTTPVIASGNCP
jgi:hypothetical protein